jgi:OCT family organic cation transporter-like MFS transporter 4/5
MCNLPEGTSWSFEHRTATVTSEFDLVCDKAWIVPMLASLFFVGVGVGASLVGWLTSQYGQRLVYIVGMIGCLVATLLSAMAQGPTQYATARFFVGAFSGAWGVTSYVLANEYVGR